MSKEGDDSARAGRMQVVAGLVNLSTWSLLAYALVVSVLAVAFLPVALAGAALGALQVAVGICRLWVWPPGSRAPAWARIAGALGGLAALPMAFVSVFWTLEGLALGSGSGLLGAAIFCASGAVVAAEVNVAVRDAAR